jgi:NQR2, RnfD, RnfE family
VLLVGLIWLLGPLGSGRIHPVVAAYLVLVIFFRPILVPHYVLRPDHLFLGNLFDAQAIDTSVPRTAPWIYQRQPPAEQRESLYNPDPAAERLGSFTSGHEQPDRFSISLQMILRDHMPPLEDLILGGEPGPIGASSAVAVIMGGLFLLFRGLIDCWIPSLAVVAAFAAFLILPLPVVITDAGAQWQWLALRPHYLDWQAAVTLANYELLASPLLLVLFFLATSPQARPIHGRARVAFGLLLGLLCAPAQLYGSVAFGPYVALLLVSLASPVLDRLFRPKPVV